MSSTEEQLRARIAALEAENAQLKAWDTEPARNTLTTLDSRYKSIADLIKKAATSMRQLKRGFNGLNTNKSRANGRHTDRLIDYFEAMETKVERERNAAADVLKTLEVDVEDCADDGEKHAKVVHVKEATSKLITTLGNRYNAIKSNLKKKASEAQGLKKSFLAASRSKHAAYVKEAEQYASRYQGLFDELNSRRGGDTGSLPVPLRR